MCLGACVCQILFMLFGVSDMAKNISPFLQEMSQSDHSVVFKTALQVEQ